MDKIFNIVSTFKSTTKDDGSVVIRGMASTNDTDRVGDVISPDAWVKGGLDNFKKNPIILFNHNYDKPVGKATEVNPLSNGLEIEVNVSKYAPDHVAELVKEGILGAFSVGFRIKDADYIEQTDGLLIKDAELFEVSIVSVPCNQGATFSVAKSFSTEKEYQEYKQTLKGVNLASQSLAEDEVNASNPASDAQVKPALAKEQENPMDPKDQPIDLEAFAKKVAADTAAQIALANAKAKAQEDKERTEKAAAEAAEATKAAALEAEKTALRTLIDEKMAEKEAAIEAKEKAFADTLAEKDAEIEKMRTSKRVFGDRSEKADLTKWGEEFMKAHLLGVMTNKGMETDFAQELQEKAGIDYTTNAGDIDQEVSRQIEKEIMRDLKVARLFREMTVNGLSTVLPIQVDTALAQWATNATSGNLSNRGAANNKYEPKQVILTAHRLISSTYMDNEVDEQVLVNLMPMLVEGVARSHARSVEVAILLGNGGTISGLAGFATAGDTLSVGASDKLTSAKLLAGRQSMGKYGINPSELVYIVSQSGYYDLLSDPSFQTIDEVGSDMAVRITGSIGAVYGTPVVVSEELGGAVDGNQAAFIVNTRNYLIPRLRGISVEQDYEVMEQRRVIVATQSLGFNQILPAAGIDIPSIKLTYVA